MKMGERDEARPRERSRGRDQEKERYDNHQYLGCMLRIRCPCTKVCNDADFINVRRYKFARWTITKPTSRVRPPILHLNK